MFSKVIFLKFLAISENIIDEFLSRTNSLNFLKISDGKIFLF